MSGEIPECVECGACCFSPSERCVRVRGDDYARLGDEAASRTHWIGNEAFMNMEAGHCAALVVEGGHYFCSIYAARPQICRDLGRGSPACDAERWEKRPEGRRLAVIA